MSTFDTQIMGFLSPHVAPVGTGARVKEFLKLVQYSQRYDPLKLSVERHQFPLCCCNSAGKQGTKT